MGFLTREFNRDEDFSGPVIPGNARPLFVDSSFDPKTGKSRHGDKETGRVFDAFRLFQAIRKVLREAVSAETKLTDYDQFFQ